MYLAGAGLNMAGLAAGAGEYSNVYGGMWRGANSKWYSLDWGGNQWTGARSKVVSRATGLKVAGRVAFGVSTGISLYQGGTSLARGDYGGAVKSGFDIGFGAVATFGGVPGLIIGGGYIGLDMLGAFDGGPAYSGPPAPFAAPDNTRVRW